MNKKVKANPKDLGLTAEPPNIRISAYKKLGNKIYEIHLDRNIDSLGNYKLVRR